MKSGNSFCKDNETTMDAYRSTLLKFILSKESDQPVNTQQIKEIVVMLSYYICSTDEAYRYNLPFLRCEYEKMISFIEASREKANILETAYREVSENLSVEAKNNHEELSITIDDFLEISNSQISLCDNIDFSNATKSIKNSDFTIRYRKDGNEFVRTYKISSVCDHKNGKIEYTPLIKNAISLFDTDTHEEERDNRNE